MLLWLIPSHISLSRAFLITYTCQVKNTPHKTPCYYKRSIIRSDQRFANSYIDGSYSKQPHKPKLIPTNVNMIPGQRLNDWGKNTETQAKVKGKKFRVVEGNSYFADNHETYSWSGCPITDNGIS